MPKRRCSGQLGEVLIMRDGFQRTSLPHHILIFPVHSEQTTLGMAETHDGLMWAKVTCFNHTAGPKIPPRKLFEAILLRLPNAM